MVCYVVGMMLEMHSIELLHFLSCSCCNSCVAVVVVAVLTGQWVSLAGESRE